MAYHYRECGLDNVWLENGYQIHNTPYGEGVSINETQALHKAIGLWLIGAPKPLNGAELRFFRMEMEQTQRDLAAVLGATEQTLRLWEKNRNKALPGPADRLLRALYKDFATGDGSVRQMLERLARLDQRSTGRACLRETSRGWEIDEDASLAA